MSLMNKEVPRTVLMTLEGSKTEPESDEEEKGGEQEEDLR